MEPLARDLRIAKSILVEGNWIEVEPGTYEDHEVHDFFRIEDEDGFRMVIPRGKVSAVRSWNSEAQAIAIIACRCIDAYGGLEIFSSTVVPGIGPGPLELVKRGRLTRTLIFEVTSLLEQEGKNADCVAFSQGMEDGSRVFRLSLEPRDPELSPKKNWVIKISPRLEDLAPGCAEEEEEEYD